MEENKIWANLNDSYNLDIILIENNNLKKYLPKVDVSKINPQIKKIEQTNNLEIQSIEILNQDYTTLNILDILHKQNIITLYLIKLFRSNQISDLLWDSFKPFLSWILETSKQIILKTNIPVVLFKTDKIYRSSYKFCTKKDDCEAIYGNILKKNNNRFCKCNGDHYVHNKIVSDLTSIIHNFNTGDLLSNDLRVCLDTMNFVINHMYQELNNFNIYYAKQANFDINKFYITSIPKRF